MSLPILYKKTSTGAIQYWEISTTQKMSGALIRTAFGQVGTDNPQETADLITTGKNIGKKNETTALQQAEAEAKARWTKQKKKGYVDSLEAAQAGELDAVIEGGINPMLAHSYADHGHKVVYPAFAQPKLDGIRCIAILSGGKATLWTRTRKLITSMPHIVAGLEELFPTEDIILDGELYNHELKNDFEQIVSLVRQEVPAPEHTKVHYYIYDIPSNPNGFDQRNEQLFAMNYYTPHCRIYKVIGDKISSELEVMNLTDLSIKAGYEGVMVRSESGKYENKRSYTLLKVKRFDDAEFKIVGVNEGRGKLQGHAATFTCETADGTTFEAKLDGDLDRLKVIFNDPGSVVGKMLTVKFQGYTNKNNVPRFPVGKAIRDYE